MEKHEFKYHRKSFAVKITIAAFAIGLLSVIIADALPDNLEVLSIIITFAGGIIFVSMALYGLIGANTKGVGILHDEYVEIKLKDREYKINYDQITKINEKIFTPNRRWRIRIKDAPLIVLHKGSGFRNKTNLYPLENFMIALYKRLKLEQYC